MKKVGFAYLAAVFLFIPVDLFPTKIFALLGSITKQKKPAEWIDADRNGDGYGGVVIDKECYDWVWPYCYKGPALIEMIHQDCDDIIFKKLVKIVPAYKGSDEWEKKIKNAIALSSSGINVKNAEGRPFMVWCTKRFTYSETLVNLEKNFETLIKLGGDVNARDVNGRTPIFYASRFVILNLLLKHGAKVNIFGAGKTPLLRYCWKSNFLDETWNDGFNAFVKAGADINERSNDDGSVLLYALQSYCRSPHMHDYIRIIKMLIDRSARITPVEIKQAKQVFDEKGMFYFYEEQNRQLNKYGSKDKQAKTKILACYLASLSNPKPRKNFFDIKIRCKKFYES